MEKTLNKSAFLLAIVTILLLAIALDTAEARPRGVAISRQKRVSDQRLAELETLMALSRMRGKLVTVPVAFDRVDPAKIGRRRRSSVEYDLQKLQRFLQSTAQDSASEETEAIISPLWVLEEIRSNNNDDTEDPKE